MSSAYPVIWAMKHAPVADAFERLILIAMADAADEDGCNSYRSMRSHMRIAKDVSKSTIVRRQADMAKRGLIRPDTTPPQQAYLDIPEYKRPPRWEVCIPASWWSGAQLEEVNRRRADLGLELITPKSRPDLPDAPEKPKRADKGVPAPKRGRKKKQVARGVSETPPPKDDVDRTGCLRDTRGGVSETRARGVSETPNPPVVDLPHGPSSLPALPAAEKATALQSRPSGREDESPNDEDTTPRLGEALSLVDAAVRLWPRGHKAPGTNDRQRLAQRVAAELATGGEERFIIHELSRDMSDVGDAMRVMMGSRTKVAGWGRNPDPRPDHTKHEVDVKRPWCGQCSEKTRMVHVVVDEITGETRPGRCRQPVVDVDGATVACHPKATLPIVFDGQGEDALEGVDVAAESRASLEEAAEAKRRRDKEIAAAKAAARQVQAAADRERKVRVGSRR